MRIIFDRTGIWIAPNKIFYTTANAVQIRGRTWNEIYGGLHAKC